MKAIIAAALMCTVGFVATLALINYGPNHTGLTVAATAAIWLAIEVVAFIRRHRDDDGYDETVYGLDLVGIREIEVPE